MDQWEDGNFDQFDQFDEDDFLRAGEDPVAPPDRHERQMYFASFVLVSYIIFMGVLLWRSILFPKLQSRFGVNKKVHSLLLAPKKKKTI